MKTSENCQNHSFPLAMAVFPIQKWCEPYDGKTALLQGTIFPCLDMEFYYATKTEEHSAASTESSPMSRQEELFQKLNILTFAINDLTLYLDTHPECQNGLSLFKELLKKRLEILAEHARIAFPFTQMSMITGTPECHAYTWADGPAPWEGGCI